MIIRHITVREILDSRGEPTIEVGVLDAKGNSARTQVPQGKSKGSYEAVSLIASEAEYIVRKKVAPALEGKRFRSITELDRCLLELDGTQNKSVVGGNVMLGISLSFAKLRAGSEQKELWEVVRDEYFPNESGSLPPMIFANFVNGGAHAKNELSFQEYLVVAMPKVSIRDSVSRLSLLYSDTRLFLEKRLGVSTVPIGDEAGFSAGFEKNDEPFLVLKELIQARGFDDMKLATDAAATSFYSDGIYTVDGNHYNAEELRSYYKTVREGSDMFFSVEDPFMETDITGFAELKRESDLLVIGDDLTVTNPDLIKKAVAERAISGVIIKPNQIGTLTETAEAVRLCKQHKLLTIFSHRSGETEDAFIIQLARAANADGVKIGPPARERVIKYDELLRLYA